MTEPYWRRDKSRADRGHSGLGLALASAIADATSLKLEFKLLEGDFIASLSPSDRGDSETR